MAELFFDATQVQPETARSHLPAGDYEVIIEASEKKPNSKGTGHFLQLNMKVLNGDYQNRTLRDFLNIDNPNKQAEDIAKSRLSAICHAIGVKQLRDSNQLHNQPLVIKVAVEPDKDKPGTFRNVIKGYESRSGQPVATAGSTQAAPWKR